jgi:hypothetical protein
MFLTQHAIATAVFLALVPPAGADPTKEMHPTVVAVCGGQQLKLSADAEKQATSLALELMNSTSSYIGGVKVDSWDSTLLKPHLRIVFPKMQTATFFLHQVGRPEKEEVKYNELLFGSGFGYIRNGDDVRAWTKYSAEPAMKLDALLREAVRAGDGATVTGKRDGQAVKVNADTAKEAASLAVDLLTRTDTEVEAAIAAKRWKDAEKQSHLHIVLSKSRNITHLFSRGEKMIEEKVEMSELIFISPHDEEPDTMLLVRSGEKVRGFGKKHPESWASDARIWLELHRILKEAPGQR